MQDEKVVPIDGQPAESAAPPVLMPKCPHCGKDLPGLNVSMIALPTPQGMMTFLVPTCPFPECGRAITAQFIGYQQPQVGAPPPGLWTPGRAS